MSRINTNVNSLIAQRILGQQNTSLSKSLERLSTGLAINRGGDDPAGLIASEKLRSEKAAIGAALGNAERADQVVNIAEGGLQEVSSLLVQVQNLVGASGNDAGLSSDEKEANQLQVDAILQTIDRIASTTSFQGTKLLNGSLDFQVTGQSASVTDFKVNGAKLVDGTDLDVKVLVTASAQHAGVFLSAGGANLDLTTGTDRFTFDLAGAKGARQFSFASGTALTDIESSINTFTSVTGVSAHVSGTGIVIKSTDFGSDQFVSVKVSDDGGQIGGVVGLLSGNEKAADTANSTAFASATSAIRDDGQDIGAIINGISARGQGTTASVNTDTLDANITLSDTASQTLASVSAFSITGGGAKFNIGPTVDLGNQVRLGIANVAARNLGNQTDGFLTSLGAGQANNLVDGNVETAQKIVNKAIDQVSSLRGRLGAFQSDVLSSTINSLGISLENTSAAEAAIRDTDFASETAQLTRSQILVSAATQALSIANAQPQNVLKLIG